MREAEQPHDAKVLTGYQSASGEATELHRIDIPALYNKTE